MDMVHAPGRVGRFGLFNRAKPSARATISLVGALAVAVLLWIAPVPAAGSAQVLSWHQIPPGGGPGPHANAAEAYDPVHHYVLLFGGEDSDFLLHNETFTWDGTAWTQQHPTTSPTPRDGMGLAFDSTHQSLILFGGYTDAGTYSSDTWSWTGTDWVQLHPTKSPPARAGFTPLTDDPAIGGLLLFGGYDATSLMNDTWKWNGTNWVKLTPATKPGRRDGTLAYSSTLGKAVLFGGYTGTTWTKQTWAFDGTTWSQLAPTKSPPARAGNGMASFGGQPVIFGGYGVVQQVATYLGDTWQFDGSTWSKLSTGPAPRSVLPLAYDSDHNDVVLFGGYDGHLVYNDTWTLGP